jgi:hypothetical protein
MLHKAAASTSSTSGTADVYAKPKAVRALKLVFAGLLQATNGFQRPPPPVQLRALTELLLALQQRLVKQCNSSSTGAASTSCNSSSGDVTATAAAHCDLLDCECPQHWDTPCNANSINISSDNSGSAASNFATVPSLGLDDVSETCVALSWCSNGSSDETAVSVTADSVIDGSSSSAGTASSARLYGKSLVTAYSTEEAFNHSYSCTAAASSAASTAAVNSSSGYRRGRKHACMTLQVATNVTARHSSGSSSCAGVFTDVAWSLTDEGCFTVEGLIADTRYLFRLTKTPQTPLSRYATVVLLYYCTVLRYCYSCMATHTFIYTSVANFCGNTVCKAHD